MLFIVATLLLLLHGASCGHSSQNFFADNLPSFVPRDAFPLRDIGFEVDVMNDTVLEAYPFELVNGKVWRFQRRVQRAGDCERTFSAGGTLHIACALSFAGLMARYDVVDSSPAREESLELQFFVREGHGRIEVAATQRKPTQLTTLRLSSLKMEMKELNRLLVHPDIDAIFALKATENVERTLWEVLEISYAALISEMLQSIRPRLPMSP